MHPFRTIQYKYTKTSQNSYAIICCQYLEGIAAVLEGHSCSSMANARVRASASAAAVPEAERSSAYPSGCRRQADSAPTGTISAACFCCWPSGHRRGARLCALPPAQQQQKQKRARAHKPCNYAMPFFTARASCLAILRFVSFRFVSFRFVSFLISA